MPFEPKSSLIPPQLNINSVSKRKNKNLKDKQPNCELSEKIKTVMIPKQGDFISITNEVLIKPEHLEVNSKQKASFYRKMSYLGFRYPNEELRSSFLKIS